MKNTKSKNKDSQIPDWARRGHKKPVTRREFLAHGLIPFAASVALPNWLSLLMPSEAFAQGNDCPVPDNVFIPFITLNLEGGAAMCGNFIPHSVGGQNLPSYDRLGMGSMANLVRSTVFANRAPFAGGDTATTSGSLQGNTFTAGTEGDEVSRMLRGLRRRSTATALQNTSFVAACVRSADDAIGNSENRFAVDGMLQRAGLGGSILPFMGSRSTPTGMTMRTPAVFTPSAPLVVNSTAAITAALSYSQTISQSLNANQRNSLARTILNLSAEQNRKIASDASGSQVKKLLDCAGVKNLENIQAVSNGGGGAILSPAVQSIWGINGNTAATNMNNVFATIVSNVLTGNAGSGVLEIGNCDYHNDGTRDQAHTKDLEIGDTIGRILATAEAVGRPVFIYVTSNGAVNSVASNTPGEAQWREAGECGGAYMICYRPTLAPIVEGVGSSPSWQIGGFTNGQVVDETQVGGNNSEKIAAAVVVNWLHASGQSSRIAQAINGTLTNDEIARILRFRS